MVTTVKVPDIRFQVRLREGEDGYWVVECPNLPGCVSQGRTRREAIANIREAIQGWLEGEAVAQAKGGRPVWERHSQ